MYILLAARLDGLGIDSRWEARFSALINTGTWANPGFCTTGTGSFSGRQSGRDVALTTYPQLAPKFSKVWSCTFVPSICLHSLFYVELYLLLCIYNIYRVSQEECPRLREGVPYVKVYR